MPVSRHSLSAITYPREHSRTRNGRTVSGLALVPAVLLILLSIAVISRRSQAKVDSLHTEPFTISPFVSWFIIGSSLAVLALSLFISFHDLVSDPAKIPPFVFAGDAGFVGCLAIGCYCLTLKIYVNDSNLVVSSLFGTRYVMLRDIVSVRVEDNLQWRTLYAYDTREKRVLYISSALRGFDELADLLSDRVSGSRANSKKS